MDLKVLFLVSCFFIVSSYGCTDDPNASDPNKAIANSIKLLVKFVMLNVGRYSNRTLKDTLNINIPDDNSVIIGNAVLNDIQLFNLDTMKHEIETCAGERDVYVKFNISFDKIGFGTKYEADMGIVDEIPIYGIGEISAMTNVMLNLYLPINFETITQPFLEEDVSINLAFRKTPSAISLTGFWKQEMVSNLLSSLLSMGQSYLVMWWDYEEDCLNCVITEIVKILVNKKLEINCDCLNSLIAGQTNLKENIEELTGEILNGTPEKAIRDLLQNEEIKKFVISACQKLATMLEEELNRLN